MPGIAAASPARTMWCCAGIGFSGDGSTGSSRAQLSATPSRTRAAAAARFASVTKFSAPRSSSGPKRPQLFTCSKIRSRSVAVRSSMRRL